MTLSIVCTEHTDSLGMYIVRITPSNGKYLPTIISYSKNAMNVNEKAFGESLTIIGVAGIPVEIKNAIAKYKSMPRVDSFTFVTSISLRFRIRHKLRMSFLLNR